MFKWLRNVFSRKPAATGRTLTLRRRRRLNASYDLAQDSDDTRRHWAAADSLSAASANTLDVRKVLRERSRYESANNSYCRGMVLTIADALVGTGPRLQLQSDEPLPLTPPASVTLPAPSPATQVERAFAEWARAVGLAEKLRILVQAKKVDGEAFAAFTTNEMLPTSVKLDIQPIECDRVTDPTWAIGQQENVEDGIEYDGAGNPVSYYVLDSHPGDSTWRQSYKRLPASQVMHWFRRDRAGQLRGVPELTPALPLFAQLRRYTLAVITAAETAADFAALLETGNSPDGEQIEGDPFETLEIERGMMTTLPAGVKLAQLKAEQPCTNYEQFKREVLNEIARCLNMPYNVAAGTSMNMNFSSGRLDHQTYFKSIRVERHHGELVLLFQIFSKWLDEAVMIPGLLPDGLDMSAFTPRWFWDGWEHVDPEKDARTDQSRLASRTTTLAEIYAERGLDWEEALRQRAREIALVHALGLPPTIEEDPGQPWQQDQGSDFGGGDSGDGQGDETASEEEASQAASSR